MRTTHVPCAHRPRKRSGSKSLACAVGLAAALVPGATALYASQLTDTWTGTTGNWSTASNWSLGVVPNNATNTYLVVIDGNNAVNSVVTQDVSASIDGLTIDSGDSLGVNNALSLQILNGGSVTDNGTLSLNGTGNFTDLHFNGGLSLAGSGTINLSNNANNRIYSNNGGQLTLAAGLTLTGSGQLGVAQTAVTNAGTITASGSAGLILQPSSLGFTNTATMQAATGGLLILRAGTFTNTGGTITAQNGGEVRLDAATVTNGNLGSLGTGFVHDVNNIRLDGVTLSGSYVQDNNTATTLLSGLTNNAQINLNSTGNFTDLILGGDVTIGGTGKIQLSANANNRLYASAGQHLTIGSNQTIQGSGQIGIGITPVTNNGLIIADGAGGLTLQPNGGGFTNTGTLQAINGSSLTLQGQFSNTGPIQIGDTSQLRLSLATVTGGSITAAPGATLHTVNGGVSTLTQVTASGNMFIDAGTLAVNNVTYTGNVTVANNTAFQLAGTFTQTGDIALNSTGNFTDLNFVGSQMLGGTGTINLSNNLNNRIYSTTGGTLTLPSTRTIQGAGQLGVGLAGLVNAGTIDGNQTTGLIIEPNSAGLLNTGTLEATAGGLLTLQNRTFTNSGATIQALAGSEVRLQAATIVGGNLTAVGTGMIHNVSSATLNNVTLAGTYNQDNNTATTLVTGLTNNSVIGLHSTGNFTDLIATGDITLGGAGSVQLSDNVNNRIYSSNNSQITFNQNVSGSGQIGVGNCSLVNHALIDADASQGITIQPGAGGMSNAGTLQASNGGFLLLQGSYTNTGPGIIQALAGSQVRLQNASITGGSLTAAPTATISEVSNVTLDNVTLGGTYNQPNNTATLLLHTFTNNGTVNLGSTGNFTDLIATTDVTLAGTGSIVLTDSANNRIYSNTGAHLTIGSGQTIRGSGQVGVGLTGIINNGTIDATGVAGITVSPSALGLTNAGTIQADNGSFITLQNGTFTNSPGATLQALGNSQLRLAQATVVNGTLSGAVRTLSTGTLQNATISGSLTTDPGTNTIFAHNATPLTSTLSSLTLGGSSAVNLGNNSLLINYGAGPSPVTSIRAALLSGYNHGAWNGPGINTSNGSSSMGLGYADTADGGIAGLPANSNAVLVKFTVVGDLNLDGTVNFADLLRLAQNYGGTNARWDQGDLNYDGSVNFNDLLALAQNYGTALAADATPAVAMPAVAMPADTVPSFAAVPEPAAVSLLLGAGLLTRRRKRFLTT